MENRKTIFCPFIIQNDHGGGTKSTISLLNGLVEREFEVYVLLTNDCEFISKFDNRIKIHFYKTYPDVNIKKPFQFLKICSEMANFVLRFNPSNTILLCSDRPGLMMMPFVSKKYTVFYISRGWHYNSFSAQLLRKIMFKRVNKFICISDKQFGVIHDIVKNENRIQTIYNGFDLPNKQFTPFLNKHKIVLSTIGVICKRKAQLQCLEMINFLKNNYSVVLNIYGTTLIEEDEKYKQSLENYIKEKGLGGIVFFMGHEPDLDKIYSSTDIVISSAIEEGFGRTLIESMAYGIPIIANSGAGGPKSIITDGFDGFLYNGSVEDLSSKIEIIINQKHTRDFIISNALKTVADKFSVNKMCDNYHKVIDFYFKEKIF